ncbi:MAG: sulfotransferase family 2 domain-containing protein [Ardenticatenaceae bacterium]|nr:sulfotransferase family 2 domain-containing protein [Ardenticatenaceae bacterium]
MLAFIHIEKCAGQTVHWILRSSYGLNHCDILPWQGYNAMDPLDGYTASDLQRLQTIYPRLKSIAGHKVRAYTDLKKARPDVQFFALVREPMKRQVSHFQFLKGRRQLTIDFEEWVQTNDWGPNWQTRMLTGTDDVNEAIRIIQEKQILVGPVEHFDEWLLLVQGLLANDLDIAYQRKNVASDKTLANQLLADKRTRAILEEQNKADIALYNYIKDELYPTFKQQYGPQLAADLARFQNDRGQFNRRRVWQSRIYRNLVYMQAVRWHRLRLRKSVREVFAPRKWKFQESQPVSHDG